MNKFTVNVKEVHTLPVEVEANNADEAREIAKTMIADCTADFDVLEYSHTLPSSEWEVIPKE